MVVALNMMDEVDANGGSVNVKLMSEQLGVPVIPICAPKNEGVSELVNQAVAVAKKRIKPAVQDFCPDGAVHRCIHAVAHVIEDHARNIGVSARFCATKLIEGDESLAERLELDQNELDLIEHSVLEMENETGFDRNEGACGHALYLYRRRCRRVRRQVL